MSDKEKLEIAYNYLLELAYLLEIDDNIINNRFCDFEQFYKAIVEKAEYVKFQSDEYDSEKA